MIENAALHIGVQLSQSARLAVLLRYELLVEGRDLDIEVVLGEVEVRREPLSGGSLPVPGDIEGGGFVSPVDLIEVKQLCELPLAIVSERYPFVRKRRNPGLG